MEKQGRYVNVKTSDGKVLLSLYFSPSSGVVLESSLDGRPDGGRVGSGGNGGNGSRSNGDVMTFPQKRLLYRLMAQEGFAGEAATDELLKLFGADSFNEVGKSEASRMIDRLLKEAGEGGGDGSPI